MYACEHIHVHARMHIFSLFSLAAERLSGKAELDDILNESIRDQGQPNGNALWEYMVYGALWRSCCPIGYRKLRIYVYLMCVLLAILLHAVRLLNFCEHILVFTFLFHCFPCILLARHRPAGIVMCVRALFINCK